MGLFDIFKKKTSQNSNASKKIEKEEPVTKTEENTLMDEKTDISLSECLTNCASDLLGNHMVKICEEKLPETGKFPKLYMIMDIPETQNLAFIALDPSEHDSETQRTFSIHVKRKNSDKMYTHFLKFGTKAEIIEYLKSEDAQKDFVDSVCELSDRADKE